MLIFKLSGFSVSISWINFKGIETIKCEHREFKELLQNVRGLLLHYQDVADRYNGQFHLFGLQSFETGAAEILSKIDEKIPFP